MRFKRLENKAQSTLEYVLIVVMVVGAYVAMRSYMERAAQAKLQFIADQIEESIEDSGHQVTSDTLFTRLTHCYEEFTNCDDACEKAYEPETCIHGCWGRLDFLPCIFSCINVEGSCVTSCWGEDLGCYLDCFKEIGDCRQRCWPELQACVLFGRPLNDMESPALPPEVQQLIDEKLAERRGAF